MAVSRQSDACGGVIWRVSITDQSKPLKNGCTRTSAAARHSATLHTISARVPELEGTYERGLPQITRQRLQWGSSLDVKTATSIRGDLWLFNHLAGGTHALAEFGLPEPWPSPAVMCVACPRP